MLGRFIFYKNDVLQEWQTRGAWAIVIQVGEKNEMVLRWCQILNGRGAASLTQYRVNGAPRVSDVIGLHVADLVTSEQAG